MGNFIDRTETQKLIYFSLKKNDSRIVWVDMNPLTTHSIRPSFEKSTTYKCGSIVAYCKRGLGINLAQ